MGLNRFMYDNRVRDSTMVLTASSATARQPASALQDQLRQETWRTAGPWVITIHNCIIPIFRGGVLTSVTVPLATYTTGAALAAAAQAALIAAAPGGAFPNCVVDYNVGAAFSFRIRDTGGAPLNFDLRWASSADAYRAIGVDLGFAVADTGSTTNITAPQVSYQSRHYLILNQSDAATIPATCAVLLQHSLTINKPAPVTSAATIQANATNVWSAPTFSEAFSSLVGANGNRDPCVQFFASAQSFPYWRLVIDDVQNPIGYAELGILFLGNHVEPATCCADTLTFTGEDFSQVVNSISGCSFQNEEPERKTFSIGWLELVDAGADEVILDAFDAAMPVGRAFFFTFAYTDAEACWYVAKAAGARKIYVPVNYWSYEFGWAEQL